VWTVVLGVLVGALATVAVAADPGTPPVPVVRLGAATVQVRASGCGPDLTATGVRVADGRVLTNRHAVVGEQVAVEGSVAESVRVASRADVASIAPGTRGIGIDLAREPAAPGDDVWVGSRRDGDVHVHRARITSAVRGTGPDDPPFAWRLDRPVRPGDSGGPVVDERGDLVGIVYAAERGSSAGLVIPIGLLEHERFTTPSCG